jgi:hypothetical protein
MSKINRSYFNCSIIVSLFSITSKLFLFNNKNTLISKSFAYMSLFCLLGSLFFVYAEIEIDFINQQMKKQQQQQYNIINMAWAENMTGTKMQIILLAQ